MGNSDKVLILERLGSLEIAEHISSGGSSGDVKKWICRKNDELLYVKVAGTRNGGRWYEPEAECVASRLGEMLGLRCVRYILDRVKSTGEVVSVSKHYLPGIDRVSLYAAMGEHSKLIGYGRYKWVVNKFPGIRTDLNKMLMFDYIIGNTDRHLRNIEIVNFKGKAMMPPIFDNGKALFSEVSTKRIKGELSCSGNFVHSRPFLNPHCKQIEIPLGEGVKLKRVRKVDVYRLVNSYFKGERARLVNKWLIRRLTELGLIV